jgi:hypothetical protein
LPAPRYSALHCASWRYTPSTAEASRRVAATITDQPRPKEIAMKNRMEEYGYAFISVVVVVVALMLIMFDSAVTR